MMLKLLGSLAMLVVVDTVCCSQEREFMYTPLAGKYIGLGTSAIDITIPKDAFDITNDLPRGHVKDGTVDYTSQIQRSIDEYRMVVFPNFPVMINRKGINLPSGSTLYFRKKSQILMKPSLATKFEALRIHGVSNVTVYNAQIIGDRRNSQNREGEWGMGIAIRGSSNVSLYSPIISECWGDGIYVGQIESVASKNILIDNPVLDFNRRNGVSITSVVGIKLINPIVTNTYGTAPMGGIVIEPNTNEDQIRDVEILSPVTFNNYNYGIVVGLAKLIGDNYRRVTIKILNHIDESSSVGFFMGGSPGKQRKPGWALRGKVLCENPRWIDNFEPFRFSESFGRMPVLELRNVVIQRPRDNSQTRDRLRETLLPNHRIFLK